LDAQQIAECTDTEELVAEIRAEVVRLKEILAMATSTLQMMLADGPPDTREDREAGVPETTRQPERAAE